MINTTFESPEVCLFGKRSQGHEHNFILCQTLLKWHEMQVVKIFCHCKAAFINAIEKNGFY